MQDHLLSIIEGYINPNTLVWSDGWVAYNPVAMSPGVAGQETVSNSIIQELAYNTAELSR